MTRAELPRAAHAPAPAHDPRMPGRRRHRAAEGGLVQPGLPRRPAEGGVRPAAARKARGRPRRARRSGSPSTRSSAGPRRRAPGATRPASCRSIRRPRGCRRGASASWLGGCAAWSGTRSSRCRARLRARRRAGRARRTRSRPRTGPSRSTRCPSRAAGSRFEELFLFQLALVMRRRTRSETREAELLEPPGDARAAAGSSRCRSSSPTGSARRSRRSTRDLVERAARCSAC